MTDSAVANLTNELTVQDVMSEPVWRDDLNIFVRSNVDISFLTSCAAELFARRGHKLYFVGKDSYDRIYRGMLRRALIGKALVTDRAFG